MADVYGTFTPSFYLASAFCMLAVVIICFIPCLKKKNDLEGGESEAVNKNSDKQLVMYESTV